MTRSILVSLRMAHHAQRSGYDRLCDVVPAEVIATPERLTFGQRLLGRTLRPLLENSGSQWYHRQNLAAEMTAAGRWVTGKGRVFHFLYGENSYRYLGAMKRLRFLRNALVVTYHTPVQRLQQVMRERRHLSHIDTVIVMSTSQMEFFADRVGVDRVRFVPHGIDTAYFTPADEAPADRLRLISVGRHLRDFDAMDGVIRAFDGSPDIEFVIVSDPNRLHRFQGIGNVTCYSDVNDETLRSLYRSSHALFMPVTDGTANNALLEAMACGLPVISTDLAAVRDYVPDGAAMLAPLGSVDSLVDSIGQLRADSHLRQCMGRLSRERAVELDWNRIAEATRKVYADALAHAR